MNMASTRLSLLLLFFSIKLVHPSESGKFLKKIECRGNQVAQCGQDSLLECVLITSKEVKDLKIKSVKWTRFPRDNGSREVVLHYYYGETVKNENYSFADPHWNNTNNNVSLLISKAAVKHEGHYECQVETSAGGAESVLISFNVTANYTPPTLKLIKGESKNEDGVLECKSIGYPEGRLCWFDQEGHNWTKSATMDSRKMEDGRFELTSRLKQSGFNIECAVFDAAGNKEHQVALPNLVPPPSAEPIHGAGPAVQIAAPLVVIGSLIVALLLLVVYKLHRRRRSPQTSISQSDVEEGDNESSVLEPR